MRAPEKVRVHIDLYRLTISDKLLVYYRIEDLFCKFVRNGICAMIFLALQFADIALVDKCFEVFAQTKDAKGMLAILHNVEVLVAAFDVANPAYVEMVMGFTWLVTYCTFIFDWFNRSQL